MGKSWEVQANKDISWSDGLFLIFYLMKRWEMAGRSWLLLVRLVFLRLLGLVPVSFRCIMVLVGRAYAVSVAGILTTGCILGLDLVRRLLEIPRVVFIHGSTYVILFESGWFGGAS
jgi:hypothetical protein